VCLWKIFFSLFFPIFGHDIRVFIKNVFSHFFRRFFSIVFCSRYTCVSGKKFFSRFSTHFWSQYSFVYKKRVFALFPDDFFPSFFAHDIRVFLEKFFSRFSSHFCSQYSCVYKKLFSHFLETIFSVFWIPYSCVF